LITITCDDEGRSLAYEREGRRLTPAGRKLRAVGAAGAAMCMVILTPSVAGAKLIPLEVQVSDGDRTVRVSPQDFYRQINVPGVGATFGVFKDAQRPARVETPALRVTLFVYGSRSEVGRVYHTVGPDARRETMATLEYHRLQSGAVGTIAPGVVGAASRTAYALTPSSAS
jgi:hypothetical protein